VAAGEQKAHTLLVQIDANRKISIGLAHDDAAAS
jgi:hypothetical protein